MSRFSWASALLLVFSASMPAHAQLLTEDRFLEDAMANHPDIAAAESAVAAADGVRRQAGIIDNPELSWEREDPDIAPRQDTWLLDWRLPFDGRRHRMAAADAGIAAAGSDLEATRLGVRLELRSLFAARVRKRARRPASRRGVSISRWRAWNGRPFRRAPTRGRHAQRRRSGVHGRPWMSIQPGRRWPRPLRWRRSGVVPMSWR
jgi:hypothetical protein